MGPRLSDEDSAGVPWCVEKGPRWSAAQALRLAAGGLPALLLPGCGRWRVPPPWACVLLAQLYPHRPASGSCGLGLVTSQLLPHSHVAFLLSSDLADKGEGGWEGRREGGTVLSALLHQKPLGFLPASLFFPPSQEDHPPRRSLRLQAEPPP